MFSTLHFFFRIYNLISHRMCGKGSFVGLCWAALMMRWSKLEFIREKKTYYCVFFRKFRNYFNNYSHMRSSFKLQIEKATNLHCMKSSSYVHTRYSRIRQFFCYSPWFFSHVLFPYFISSSSKFSLQYIFQANCIQILINIFGKSSLQLKLLSPPQAFPNFLP